MVGLTLVLKLFDETTLIFSGKKLNLILNSAKRVFILEVQYRHSTSTFKDKNYSSGIALN